MGGHYEILLQNYVFFLQRDTLILHYLTRICLVLDCQYDHARMIHYCLQVSGPCHRHECTLPIMHALLQKKNPNYLFTVPARKALKQLLAAFVACKFVTPTVLQLSRLLTTVLFSTALRCSTTEDSLKLLAHKSSSFLRTCLPGSSASRIRTKFKTAFDQSRLPDLQKLPLKDGRSKLLQSLSKKRKEKKRLLQATNNWHQDSGPKG